MFSLFPGEAFSGEAAVKFWGIVGFLTEGSLRGGVNQGTLKIPREDWNNLKAPPPEESYYVPPNTHRKDA